MRTETEISFEVETRESRWVEVLFTVSGEVALGDEPGVTELKASGFYESAWSGRDVTLDLSSLTKRQREDAETALFEAAERQHKEAA